MALAAMLSTTIGVMMEPIENELGWTRAQISTGPLVVTIMGLFLSAPAGYLIDRMGSRKVGALVILLTFAAILAMSQVGDQLWHWWAAWSIFGLSAAFTSTVWLAPVSTIFSKARGMAIAITLCGSGISIAAAPPIAEYFVQNYDWRTGYIALAFIWCGLALPLVLTLIPNRNSPAEPSEADVPEPGKTHELSGYTPREGFRSSSLYLLFVASIISHLAGLALTLNLVPVLTFTGTTRGEAVMVAGSLGIASIGGRLLGGWLMDRFDARRLAIFAALCSCVFPLTLIIAPGIAWAAMVAMIFNGMTGSMKFSTVVYLTSTHMGARSFGFFFGIIGLTTGIAQGLGPLLANYVYDLTQSYWPVIWVSLPCFLLSAVLFAALGPAPDFDRK